MEPVQANLELFHAFSHELLELAELKLFLLEKRDFEHSGLLRNIKFKVSGVD